MHGIIIKFDPEQGCGVIHCDDPKVDVSLCISEVKGEKRLRAGDMVNFTGYGGPNGPRAREVILLWRAEKTAATTKAKNFETVKMMWKAPKEVGATSINEASDQSTKPLMQPSSREIMGTLPDDRDRCASCAKLMIPNLALANGAPERSFCPFCGGIHKDFTKPSIPTIQGRAKDAVGHGIFGLIIATIFGL